LLSWQFVRTLSPALQRTISSAFFNSEENTDNCNALFLSCACLVNGYGCVVDVERALKTLRKAAELGSSQARAYLHRVHVALGQDQDLEEDLTIYLEDYARFGSLAASAGYEAVKPQESERLKQLLGDRYGGVGANWYDESEMLHGFTRSEWIIDDFLIVKAGVLSNVKDYRVNVRGDTLLHFAAACGRHRPLKILIDRYGFDVDSRNNTGDTPLICACRSGHDISIRLLLQNYNADPSLAAKNGETALHWLVSLNDAAVVQIARDLLSRGANVEAMTKERISHSKFPGTVDADFQMPGTPIAWAVNRNRPKVVRVLLEAGASVYHDNSFEGEAPLNLAAHFHRAACLKLMIDASEDRYEEAAFARQQTVDKRKAIWYSKLLQIAVHSADVFSMTLRNGTRYLQDMIETLDLLREKSSMVSFPPNFGGNNQTLFFYAVAEAHDQVATYMLEHHWHVADLNRPCGELFRTPVLQAVHWGRMPLVELLIKYGADIHARSSNPYMPDEVNWSALHILAAEGHEGSDLVELLLGLGLDIDGEKMPSPVSHNVDTNREASARLFSTNMNLLALEPTTATAFTLHAAETPLSCALRSNAFLLCDLLTAHGASFYSTSMSAGLFRVDTPTTILGHLIISNSRYSLPRLRYLLRHNTSSPTSTQNPLFVVQPELGTSAIHLAAEVPNGVRTTHGTTMTPRDFDFDTNREIMHELLSHFESPKHINMRCQSNAKTALAMALEQGKAGVVEELLAAGALE
jgi:ankyrin repeat protein